MQKNLKSIFLPTAVIALFTMPLLIAQAQVQDVNGLTDKINAFTGVASAVTNLLLVLAIVYLFYNLGNYLLNPDAEKAKLAESLTKSVIILAVMVSIWGLIALLQGVLGVDGDAGPSQFKVPTVDRSGF